MAWNDAPPSKEELAQMRLPIDQSAATDWAKQAPTPEELNSVGASDNWFGPGGKVPRYFDNSPNAKAFTKGLIEQLPGVGGMAGGMIGGAAGIVEGAPTGFVASPYLAAGQGIAGAGLGYGAGKSLENFAKDRILGESKSAKDQLIEPVKGIGTGAMNQMTGYAIGGVANTLAESPIVQKAMSAIGRGASRVGEMFTGVPQDTISHYAQNAERVGQLAGESDNNTFAAADQVRKQFMNDIDQSRNQLGETIGEALKNSDKRVDGRKIIGALEQAKSKIDPDLYPEQVAKVDDLMTKIISKFDNNDTIHVSDAHVVKRFLQDKATQAYRNPGDIFGVGTEGAKAARAGAAVARDLVNEAEPTVAAANNQLSKLHDIEDTMNSNLIAEGKPEAALLSAGAGTNQRNADALKKLGDMTGTDMLGKAKDLAAMRTFGKPGLMPTDTNGKAVGRMGLGAGLGFLMGHAPGAVVGSAMTSPAMLKAAINGGLITKDIAQGLMSTPAGQQLIGAGLLNYTPKDAQSPDSSVPDEANSLLSTPAMEPVKKKGK